MAFGNNFSFKFFIKFINFFIYLYFKSFLYYLICLNKFSLFFKTLNFVY